MTSQCNPQLWSKSWRANNRNGANIAPARTFECNVAVQLPTSLPFNPNPHSRVFCKSRDFIEWYEHGGVLSWLCGGFGPRKQNRVTMRKARRTRQRVLNWRHSSTACTACVLVISSKAFNLDIHHLADCCLASRNVP